MAATLTITDNASGSPHMVTLNGCGRLSGDCAVDAVGNKHDHGAGVHGNSGSDRRKRRTNADRIDCVDERHLQPGNCDTVGGSATVNIPPGALAAGTDTILAMYTPDNASAKIYAGATGENSMTVTASSTATAPAAATALRR